MITTLIFDFFDVVHRDLQKAWLANNGYQRDGGFAEASDKLDGGQISLQEYLEWYGRLSDRPAETVQSEMAALSQLNTELVELIRGLHGQYKTALISNAHASELRPLLEQHQLDDLFDVIAISSEVGFMKPDARIFMHVTQEFGVAPEECVFTDDNPANTDAAAALGMQAIVFTDTVSFAERLHDLGVLAD